MNQILIQLFNPSSPHFSLLHQFCITAILLGSTDIFNIPTNVHSTIRVDGRRNFQNDNTFMRGFQTQTFSAYLHTSSCNSNWREFIEETGTPLIELCFLCEKSFFLLSGLAELCDSKDTPSVSL